MEKEMFGWYEDYTEFATNGVYFRIFGVNGAILSLEMILITYVSPCIGLQE